METSPLAALHRPTPVPAWGSRGLFRSHTLSHYTSATSSGPSSISSSTCGSMGLREQMHKQAAGDYFNVKEVRGSSPAASLAADLSQNFRIDNEISPQLPTPRRALFTTNLMSGVQDRSNFHLSVKVGSKSSSPTAWVTTPPLPSSSPAPFLERMEVSPLPHKLPYCTQIEVTTPTPVSTPDDDDIMLDSPAPIPRRLCLDLPRPPVVERKIAAPRRPSLSRMKNFTTSAVMSRAQAETSLPPFQFSAKPSNNQFGSQLSLGECFNSTSPPQERRPSSANNQCTPISLAPRQRLQFGLLGSNNRNPPAVQAHSRKPSNPFLRNRKQMRRSLSMFESPADIMKSKTHEADLASPGLQPVADIEEVYEPLLPHVLPDDPMDSIPRITKETLLDVLDGKYADHFTQKMIIDCRFEYEFDGGHVESAVNYNNKELLANHLFQSSKSGRTLLIFHCEYSAHRAPLMARHVRSEDRTINAEHYPRLTYPDVYILDGGYSGFFAESRDRCFPPAYVEMSDEKHQRTCEREMGRLKARKGFGRAQTFAFGQREPCVDDSPTAPSRPSSRNSPILLMTHSPLPWDRMLTRRMASY